MEKTYDNGVRIGGVENHGKSPKRMGKTGQSWFPEEWDENKIRVAGTYTANKPGIIKENNDENGNITSRWIYAKYDGVTVGVIMNRDNTIETIFPDGLQREVV